MTTLSPATVHLVLDHICPLSAPLPPHIISTPLRQRHHFLALSPDNSVDYLAWPSPNQSHAVNLLQSLPLPSLDLLFPVQYTADPENIFAHARITPDLILVFLWNTIEGWQYHNVTLMPFPASSYASLADAMALYSPDDFLPEHLSTTIISDDKDHLYWDSYGQDQDSDPISGASLDSPEDAYWAQYSIVQGSVDSTPPSPLPKKARQTDADISGPLPERIIVSSDDLQIHHREPYNPLEPPSPDTLAHRLAGLPSGSAANSPPFSDCSTADSETLSPNIGKVKAFSLPSTSHQQSDVPVTIHPECDSDDRVQSALRDSIRSLYQLWKLSRSDRPSDQHKTLFLSTIYQVIDQL